MQDFRTTARRMAAGAFFAVAVLSATMVVSAVGCGDDSPAGSADASTIIDAALADGFPEQADAGADGYVPYQPPCDDTPSTQVIGNWDLVPEQVFDGAFQVGVVAFHEYGVDVEFTVDGSALATVQNPTFNSRTGAYEYWVTLQASDYADGPITLGATIVPDCPGHESRVLEAVTLYANSGGSEGNSAVKWVDCATGDDDSGDGTEGSPYATIEKAIVEVGAGGTVYLAAGTCYTLTTLYPSANWDRWTTVQPAPGVDRSQVEILAAGPGSTGRFGEDMIRWRNVQIYSDGDPGYSTIFYMESGNSVWFDGAELYDVNGQWNGASVVGGNSPYRVYSTDVLLRDVTNAHGLCGLCRGARLENIGSDVFRAGSNLTSINMTIDTIDRGTTEAHPDFFQLYAPDSDVENIVIYNTLVTNMGAQGIFGGEGNLSDVAFVNLVMEKDPPDSALTSQLSGYWDHVLLWHVTTVDSGFMLRDISNLTNFWVQNNVWHNFHAGATTSLTDSVIDYNLFRNLVWDQPEPMGTHAIQGDPLFEDETSDNYRLSTESPARGAGAPLPGLPADIEGTLYDSVAPNLGAYAN